VAEVTSLLAEAFALHQAGRLAEAEQTYNQILATQPDHFDSLHLLDIVFHQRGDHAQALRHIDRALKINPKNIPALNNRGIALRELKRFEEALVSYDRALALWPDYVDALLGRGSALKELKRFLVISVDTSVAHLAGALAKPVWILLPFIPDRRWPLDREASPWYPTARLFRQDETRGWDNVMARVHAASDTCLRRREFS
jgi:tetratricopeptide (TPR) repeat protein